VKLHRLRLPELAVIEPAVHGDARGYFYESWNRARYAEAGLAFEVVQTNVSRSAQHVLRGLHYQWPQPQGKLVSVTEGEVYDVAVDIRRGSPTFGQWEACVLSAANRKQFWVPEGYAHGFVVLSEFATFSYLCTAAYARAFDRGLRWNDAALAINWPVRAPLLSDKDAAAPFLGEVAPENLPEYHP
jgi:dTDP-4-dehydrorhamnose 3,5-epimerase